MAALGNLLGRQVMADQEPVGRLLSSGLGEALAPTLTLPNALKTVAPFLEETVMDQISPTKPRREPWNKGKLVGQKAPLKVKDIWAIRLFEYACRCTTGSETWFSSTSPSTASCEPANSSK